jgi:hypothetical protein
MCLLCGTNWVSISEKTAFFVVTAGKTSNLTKLEGRLGDCGGTFVSLVNILQIALYNARTWLRGYLSH